MNLSQRQRVANDVAAYAKYLQPKLGLRDWHIRVVVYKAKHKKMEGRLEIGAAVLTVDNRRFAVIDVYDDSFGKHFDAEEFHHILIHELIHCATADMRDRVRGIAPTVIKRQKAHDAFIELFRQEEESLVDHMAASFADLIKPPKAIIEKLRKV